MSSSIGDWENQRAFLAVLRGGSLSAAARELGNVVYDTAASPLLYGPEIWPRFIATAGAERVLFGSDFPLNLYPRLELEAELVRLVAEAKAAGLPAEGLDGVLERNALRIFNLGGTK